MAEKIRRDISRWEVRQEMGLNEKGQKTIDGLRVSISGGPVDYLPGMQLPLDGMEGRMGEWYKTKVERYLRRNPAVAGTPTERMLRDGYSLIAERRPELLNLAVDYRLNTPLRALFAEVTGLSLTFIRAYDEKVLRMWLGEAAEGVAVEQNKDYEQKKEVMRNGGVDDDCGGAAVRCGGVSVVAGAEPLNAAAAGD